MLGKLDAYASQPHYRDHLFPIWDALDPDLRGTFRFEPPRGAGPVMVAGYLDLRRCGERPAVFVEHGAGQTYGNGKHPAYPGGNGREQVGLFICPSPRVAMLNLNAYPQAEVAVVGSPRMDRFIGVPPGEEIAVAFHFDAQICWESRSAFKHYREGLARLAQERPLLGHGHPRVWKRLEPWYREVGIEPVARFGEIVERAKLLIVDNSSIGFEWMALDRPLVWLNAPWYRRNVNHGLRFWDYANGGVECDEPEDLEHAIAEALAEFPTTVRRRREIASEVFAFADGRSADRAGRAISRWLGGSGEATEDKEVRQQVEAG